ncbi:hypothetical protein DL96DRAFT_1717512 [Flagelloscypha sp. PMI_526]|nr:hypothetical protein DL96DRAFT_1717512 [Flagelloscypha sp. PMI_526]
MACLPNAGLPPEIWLSILLLLPADEVVPLELFNTTFRSAALDIKYHTLEITHNHPKGIIKLLLFYSESFVAPHHTPAFRLFGLFGGGAIFEGPGIIQFLHDYRLQLRTLDIGSLTSQIIHRLSHLSAINSLWVIVPSDVPYFRLVDALSRLWSLRELHIYAPGLDFSAQDPSSNRPLIPDLPLLEKISLEIRGFDLFDLHRFASTFPSLRCMTIRLMTPPRLTCGIQAELPSEDLTAMKFPKYDFKRSEFFCEALLTMEPVSILWNLESLYICPNRRWNLSADVVACLPKIVPSLMSYKDFYKDWRVIPSSTSTELNGIEMFW